MLKNLGFKTKLFLLCLFLSTVSFTIAATTFFGLQRVTTKYNRVTDISLPSMVHLNDMFLQYREIRINLRSLGLPGLSKKDADEHIEKVKAAIAGYEESDKLYLKAEFILGEKELYEKVNQEWLKFKSVGVRALSLYETGKPEDHEKLLQIFFVDCPDAAAGFRSAIMTLKKHVLNGADEYVAAAKSDGQTTNTLSLTIGVVGLLAGLILGYLFSNSIVKTMLQIIDRLRDNSIRVSSASTQIATASSELSQATASQAEALEETASAMEEMSAMVTKNSNNSSTAATTSAHSKDKALAGKVVVERMIESMGAIDNGNKNLVTQINHSNEIMSDLAKVIENIGTKTKVINDIVFQTKLLSFNASVEAARAGEHGKGFAVVAEEVGKLAQMSGNAAEEISSLLNDSVKKVNDIVAETKIKVDMIVKEGKTSVEQGIEVAHQCNEVLEDIVQNITGVSTMAGEISIASVEQAKGVSEIQKAVAQLDQMTKQNATTSDGCASAAEELSSQAQTLNEVVEELVLTVVGKKALVTESAVEAPHVHQEPFKRAA